LWDKKKLVKEKKKKDVVEEPEVGYGNLFDSVIE
jgi:hypothetical protein